MGEKQETIADIVAKMRSLVKPGETLNNTYEMLNGLADRIEAAQKRGRDSIHRAMVLIAGIEMEGSEDPPRLWTALEDAYDALSDALGTDGDATADMADAEATGRHFVVKSSRNGAKMREALKHILALAKAKGLFEIQSLAETALAKPPRNCDRFVDEKQADALHKAFTEYCNRCDCPMGCDYRKNPRFLLDTNCASIMKCFARFALPRATEQEGENNGSK